MLVTPRSPLPLTHGACRSPSQRHVGAVSVPPQEPPQLAAAAARLAMLGWKPRHSVQVRQCLLSLNPALD